MPGFEDLLAEGEAVDVAGWDFSWFEGRAIEERPQWGYAKLLGERMSALASVPDAAALDLQTGGGEVLATVPGLSTSSARSSGLCRDSPWMPTAIGCAHFTSAFRPTARLTRRLRDS